MTTPREAILGITDRNKLQEMARAEHEAYMNRRRDDINKTEYDPIKEFTEHMDSMQKYEGLYTHNVGDVLHLKGYGLVRIIERYIDASGYPRYKYKMLVKGMKFSPRWTSGYDLERLDEYLLANPDALNYDLKKSYSEATLKKAGLSPAELAEMDVAGQARRARELSVRLQKNVHRKDWDKDEFDETFREDYR